MKINDKDITYPISGKFSFFKVIESLDNIVESSKDKAYVQYIESLLKEIYSVPALVEGTEDLEVIEENRELIDKVMKLMFPPTLSLNEIKGATAPFSFSFFYKSQRLENILAAAGEDFTLEISEIDPDMLYLMGCVTVLQGYYGYPTNFSVPIVMKIPEASGDIRYYRSAFNADLMRVFPTDESVEITKEDYLELMDDFHNMELWKKKFPPGSWVVKGLGIMTLMDITIDQSINMMTSNLLEGANDSVEKVMDNIKSLLRINDLNISFARCREDNILAVRRYEEDNILLNGIEETSLEEAFNEFERAQLLGDGKAVIIPDVGEYIKSSEGHLAKQLAKRKTGSYILERLEYHDETMGFLEVWSEKERELNTVVAEKLKLAVPLLSMAASRFKQEELNRIEAIIQEKCTSIHSSVKWRFEKAARDYYDAEIMEEKIEFDDLNFDEVYPLYGQMDIRSSSVLRNEAVLADLSQQLVSVKKILNEAIEKEPLPAYQEMLFRLDGYLKEFEKGLVEGIEQRVLSFLKSDVYPIFDYFRQINKSLKQSVDSYNSLLTAETKTIYNKRKDFDDSAREVNTLLAGLIDEKQKEAQKMFPHYFERYKTDGVEYNLYIGDSIAEKRKFNPIYLNNLQLWQLSSICEMELELHKLRKTLPVPLEVASLILVHNATLSIHFRMDEKRFDVEGAYNARYEIIKKRVDKAHAKGTNERITQVGKIVIVYTSKEDSTVYERHIQYLETKGYLLPDSTEFLEVEDLQGVTGLKALRVSIDYSSADQ